MRTAEEALNTGLKPLPRFRLKAELRQWVVGAPGLASKADAKVGVPASAEGRVLKQFFNGIVVNSLCVWVCEFVGV